MTNFKIRKFTHQDTESFIRVATSAFAEEWIADGMTPDGFARQTRQIFRWRMIPYKLFVSTHRVGGDEKTLIRYSHDVANKDGRPESRRVDSNHSVASSADGSDAKGNGCIAFEVGETSETTDELWKLISAAIPRSKIWKAGQSAQTQTWASKWA